MSYNPARASGRPVAAVAKARQRIPVPGSGVRHSQIAQREGPRGINVADIRNRQETQRGWRVLTFKGDEFEMVYEYICARNHTGLIKNEKQDRCFRVLAGAVFVTIGEVTDQIQTGQSFAVPKDTEYVLATAGSTDAEVLFCQGADYDKNVTQISDPQKTSAAAVSPEPKAPPQREARSTQSAVQAAKIEAERTAREKVKRTPVGKKERAPLPSQVVTGVSPRPVGAAGYGEDD